MQKLVAAKWGLADLIPIFERQTLHRFDAQAKQFKKMRHSENSSGGSTT
jgi:hypothetical protein